MLNPFYRENSGKPMISVGRVIFISVLLIFFLRLVIHEL